MCHQKSSMKASLREKVACLDCPLTKNQSEMRSKGLVELSTMFNVSTTSSLWKGDGRYTRRLAQRWPLSFCTEYQGQEIVTSKHELQPKLNQIFTLLLFPQSILGSSVFMFFI